MAETLHSLGIYWPKLMAQIVNFAIVLFVLWRFAYRPVLKMLEERRQRVAEAMINAEKAREELAKTEAARAGVLAETNAQASKMIEEARAAAAKVREQETQKAVKEAEDIVGKAREAAALERTRMLADVKRELGRLVIATTSKVTGKVLTADDQRRLTEETTRALAE
ncbi:MAG TPA: F0F1 ATP synthase subunit B [Candidatus Binatia bacterium]|nr:F0F1 ATP synthase subunit B [Candidatus Binatia bacterium]